MAATHGVGTYSLCYIRVHIINKRRILPHFLLYHIDLVVIDDLLRVATRSRQFFFISGYAALVAHRYQNRRLLHHLVCIVDWWDNVAVPSVRQLRRGLLQRI